MARAVEWGTSPSRPARRPFRWRKSAVISIRAAMREDGRSHQERFTGSWINRPPLGSGDLTSPCASARLVGSPPRFHDGIHRAGPDGVDHGRWIDFRRRECSRANQEILRCPLIREDHRRSPCPSGRAISKRWAIRTQPSPRPRACPSTSVAHIGRRSGSAIIRRTTRPRLPLPTLCPLSRWRHRAAPWRPARNGRSTPKRSSFARVRALAPE